MIRYGIRISIARDESDGLAGSCFTHTDGVEADKIGLALTLDRLRDTAADLIEFALADLETNEIYSRGAHLAAEPERPKTFCTCNRPMVGEPAVPVCIGCEKHASACDCLPLSKAPK